mmetsp:Transcript_17684/g.30944  ORF Transcript_17684/g.30944 Transcript_17684/m.30944 type:complete len:152 (-) Transcript_17684:37-492(-)
MPSPYDTAPTQSFVINTPPSSREPMQPKYTSHDTNLAQQQHRIHQQRQQLKQQHSQVSLPTSVHQQPHDLPPRAESLPDVDFEQQRYATSIEIAPSANDEHYKDPSQASNVNNNNNMSHYLAVNQIDQAGLYSTRFDDTFDTYEAVDAPFQ